MSTHDVHRATLNSLTGRLSTLRPANPIESTLIAYLAGTIYALHRAIDLDFPDSRMKIATDDIPPELRSVFATLSADRAPPKAWLSGFYVGSAMHRITAVNDRIDGYQKVHRDVAGAVRKVVNLIKHKPDAGVADGWDLSLADLVTAAQELTTLLEGAIPGRYSAA
jgi:hypothetical protein